jgi:hypothetical protein
MAPDFTRSARVAAVSLPLPPPSAVPLPRGAGEDDVATSLVGCLLPCHGRVVPAVHSEMQQA